MKNKTTQLIGRLLMTAVFLCFLPLAAWGDGWDGSPASGFSSGTGTTEDDPYIISSPAELAYLSQEVEGGNNYSGSFFKLSADIDLNSQLWTPIGKDWSRMFEGSFDGGGFQVKNLKIDIDGQGGQNINAGLFGKVQNCTIKNLGVLVSGEGIKTICRREGSPTDHNIGALAGSSTSATIKNCYTTGGNIIADTEDIYDGSVSPQAGGLIGNIDRTIVQHCYSTISIQTGTLYTDNDTYPYLGGLVGIISTYSGSSGIANCFTSGTIDNHTYGSYSASNLGGIAGGSLLSNFTIENCVTSVSFKHKNMDGGTSDINRILGDTRYTPTITNCHASDGCQITITNGSGTTTPDHSSSDATSKNGADWDGTSLPAGIFDNDNWDQGILPFMPKLKDDKGVLMPNQPDIRANPYQLTLNISGNGSVEIVSGDNEAGKDEVVEFIITPVSGYQLEGDPTVTETSGGTPVSCSLNNGKYSFVMPAAAVTISAVFSKIPDPTPDPDPAPDPEPTPPLVYQTVTLPELEGAFTDPVAGGYEVEAWSSFRFYLTLDEAYNQSVPVVTTSRYETIIPRSSDGAYIVKYVRTPVEIFIDGIVKNPDPVGNEVIETDNVKVWSYNGYLYIRVAEKEQVDVYGFNGALLKQARIPSGDTRWQLPSGAYIVKVKDKRYKVML